MQVRIPPQFWFDQLPNFQPDDSMAECHAKKARERIAEKKAEGNVEKLEQLVDQLKGKIESKDTVIKAEVRSLKIIVHSNSVHIYPETSEYWIQASFQEVLWFPRFHQGDGAPAEDS